MLNRFFMARIGMRFLIQHHIESRSIPFVRAALILPTTLISGRTDLTIPASYTHGLPMGEEK